MNATFNLSEFRSVQANLDITITISVVDSRMPKHPLEAQGISLEQYNLSIEFLKEHDHIFGMNMARERFKWFQK
jgi:hypothetical protein